MVFNSPEYKRSKTFLFVSAASVIAVLASADPATALQQTASEPAEATFSVVTRPIDSRAAITGLTYLSNTTLPTGYRYYSDPSDITGSLVAGLSGIDYDPRTGRIVTVRDNWMSGAALPGQSNFPNLLDLEATPNTQGSGYALRVSGVQPLNGGGRAVMDTLEGVRFDPFGDGLWFISEAGGSLFHWTPDGDRTEIRLPATVVRQSGNAGLEGIAFTPSGSLWVAREGTRPGDAGNISLLSKVDRTGVLLGQFAYGRDAIANNGLSEIVALSDTSFLVMERAWDGKGATTEPRGVSHNSIRVYRVDLGGATDVSALDSVSSDGSVALLTKTLVFDSAALADTLNTYETKIDNIEGMTFGPNLANGHATMMMVSDNNNSGSQGKTQFIVFKVDSPIPEVQWWDGEGPMADGNFGGDGAWRADASVENWTRTNGWVNDRWGGRTAVFGGKAGTVTIDGADGVVSAAKLAFLTDGYRIDGAPLTTSGTMIIDVGDAGRVGGGADLTATIAAAVTGSGGLEKAGLGTLRLTENSDYAGETLISSGTLALDGRVAGEVRVDRGATLTGRGAAGSVLVASGGTLNPGAGGDIGAFSVVGNLIFASGSRLLVDLDKEGRSDLVAAGSVNIARGARIALNAVGDAPDGSGWDITNRYSVITAPDGVSGRFSGVDEDFAYLTAFADYSATGVSIRLDRSTMQVSSQAYVRDVLIGQYDDLRSAHPEVAAANLSLVSAIMAEASPERRQLAIWDDTNYAMSGMADRARGGLNVSVFNPVAGEHGNLFMNAGANSPGRLHELGKSLSNSPRPCNIPIADGGVRSLFGCSGSSSYPSGHTAKATGAMVLASHIFPERMQSFLNRGQEYGESRIVAGQHLPLDVMAARAMTYKATADLLAAQVNDAGSWLNTSANPQAMRARQTVLCGDAAIAICAERRTDIFSVDTQEAYQRNRAYYRWTADYGLPMIGATDLPMEAPDNAEYLIMTRYPYLDRTQLREILRTTALPSGGVLSDPWSRINLFDAGEGYGAFETDVKVTMDAALAADDTRPGAGFHAADRWRNAIGGGGHLTKAGSGVLTLGGENSFGGFTLSGGGLILTAANRLTSASRVDDGLLVIDGGGLRAPSFTLAQPASLHLIDGTLRADATLDMAGATELTGRATIELIDAATGRIDGMVSGSGLLDKAGGGVLTLAGGATHAGGTRVSGGTLLIDGTIGGRADVLSGAVLGGSGVIGTDAQAGDVVIGVGGVLDPGNGIGTLNVSGAVTFGEGAIYRAQVNAAGASDLLNVTGAVNIANGATVVVNAHDRTESGFDYAASTRYRIVSAAGGVAGVFGGVTENFAYLNAVLGYDANGVYLTLARANTTADPVDGPRPDDPIIATDVTVASASDLGVGPILLGGGRLVSTADIASTQSLRITPEGGIIAPRADTMLTLSGDISGRGLLTKSGAGALRLTGLSTTNSDVLVQNGLLRVDGVLTGGTVTVADGASLGGIGRLGAVRVGAGGVIAPEASIGTLEAASYTFDAGSTYRIEVEATGRSDLLRTTGGVTIDGGANVVVSPEDTTQDGSTYAVSTRYTIISADGGVSGSFGPVSDSFAYLTPTLSYDASNVYLTLDRVMTGGGAVAFADVVSTANRKAVANAVEGLGAGNPVYEAALYLPDAHPEGAFEQLSGEVHSAVGTALIDLAGQTRRAMIQRTRPAVGDIGGSSGPAAVSSTGMWLSGLGAWNRYAADGNGNRLTANSGGLLGGIDRAVGSHSRIGAAVGWTRTDLSTGMTGTDTAKAHSLHLGVFGGATVGRISLRAGAGYSRDTIHTTRSVVFPRFDEALRGDYSGSTVQLFAEAGKQIKAGATVVEPYVGVAHVQSGSNVKETGGEAALFDAGAAPGQTFTTAGLRIEHRFTVGGIEGQWSGAAAWQHAFGDRAAVRALRFATGGEFDVSSTTLAQSSALLDASIGMLVGERALVSVGYTGDLGDDQTSHAATARLSIRF